MEREGDPRGLAKPFARARLAPYGTTEDFCFEEEEEE
jgi:hypothetical protein